MSSSTTGVTVKTKQRTLDKPQKSDMLKLEKAFFNSLQMDDLEHGGIGLDGKRPFGNSDLEGDILEIIEAEHEGKDENGFFYTDDQRDYARSLYGNLIDWLQEKYGK